MQILSNRTKLSLSDLIESALNRGLFLLIDKSQNWTSFDVVAKIRSITKIKKIGHAGTLDPLATGLLIVALGRLATKKIDMFREMPKTYTAEIKIGATTITNDAEGQELDIKDISELKEELVVEVIRKFIGKMEQIPPIFSAQKIDGKPAYKSARKNKNVTLRAKQIEIHNIEIISIKLPFVTIEVNCSKGTYMRSLARDIGENLGCGAYLHNLRRTSIGDFSVVDSMTIQEFLEQVV